MVGEVIAIALGLLVGLSLGALGGGGSTLAVPILVFVAGLSAQDATTASLLVVGVGAGFGVLSHLRAGNVRLGAGIAFGFAGIVGARLGTTLNASLDERVLLLSFSLLIAFVAVRMFRTVQRRGAESISADDGRFVDIAGSGGPGGATVATRQRAGHATRLDLSAASIAKLAGAATGVGLLTGLFGVGGGFAVVPALALLLGFPAKQAIGTSLVVIVINALVALAMRTGDIAFDWSLVGPFLATVTLGVIVGSRAAARLDADQLTRSFAIMLGAVAVYTALSTLFTT